MGVGGRYRGGGKEVQRRWSVVNMYCVHSGSCLKTNSLKTFRSIAE